MRAAPTRGRPAGAHMSSWGYLLLFAYVALGLSDTPPAKAVILAALITAIVIAYALVRIGAGAY